MKKTIIAALALLVASTLNARTLSPEEALSRLEEPSTIRPMGVGGKKSPKLIHTAKTLSGAPAVYVFDNNTSAAGYMIVSADDCAYPLLGYSDSGSLEGEMPPALEWWLGEYARQIEYASTHAAAAQKPALAMPRARADRPAIAPMITTMWDQGAPYNNQCPKIGAQRTYTGCVATAMAQVMNYWQYPEKGTGTITYTPETADKRLSLNLGLKKFDWENMIPTYIDGEYTEEQAAAVAYLMKACGFAVRMDYGTDSSGALAMNISRGLTKYFNYDGNISYELRAQHAPAEWETMIYENLKNVGPILYGGGSMVGGGHSFVCDGYDGEGYFHFNWGWTGMSDGYFSLDALNPYSLGAGGGSGGGYNFTQDAVLGIRPPTGDAVIPRPVTLAQTGSAAGVIANDTLRVDLFAEQEPMWINYNPENVRLKLGVIIEPIEGTPGNKICKELCATTFEFQPGYGTSPAHIPSNLYGIKLSTLSLQRAGTYKVTMATRLADDENAEWVPVTYNYGCTNSFTFDKLGSGYNINNEDVDRIEIVDGGFRNDLYFGGVGKVYVTLVNDSDRDITQGFAPLLVKNGQLIMLGESILVTVPAHQDVTREWVTPFYALQQYLNFTEDTPVQLTFMDESTYNIFQQDIFKTVTMHVAATAPEITTMKGPEVKNATVKVEQFGDVEAPVYYVTDKRDIQISCPIKLNSGVFAYPVYACIGQPNAEDDQRFDLHSYQGGPVIFDNVGQVHEFNASVSFPEAKPDQTYYIMMAYTRGSGLSPIGPYTAIMRLASWAGIDGITQDSTASSLTYADHTVTAADGAEVEVFGTQGVCVARGKGSVDVSALAPGIYIARSGASILKISVK